MKKTLLIAAIALIITAGTVSLVDAQMKEKKEMNQSEFNIEMGAEKEVYQAEMQNIMENGTYKEWKTLMESKPRMTDYITEENFEVFRKVHKLKQAGDYEGAKKLWEELGIDKEFGMRKGLRKGIDKGIRDCGCQK